MKAMILSDFILTKSSLALTFGIAIFVGAICAWSSGNVLTMGAVISAMVPTTCMISLAVSDEKNDWSGYRLCMPISRRNVVVGRYAFLALIAFVATLIGIATSCLLAAIIGTLPQDFGSASAAFDGELPPITSTLPLIVAGALLGFAFALGILALTVPLVLQFGLTRAVRFAPVVFCFAFLLVMIALGDNADFGFMITAIENSLELQILVMVGTLLAAFVIFVGSAVLSTRLYARREF